jgi:hypothetical protein
VRHLSISLLLRESGLLQSSRGDQAGLLLPRFAGRVTSIAGGFAFCLQPCIIRFLFGRRTHFLIGLFHRHRFALGRDASGLGKALGLPFRHADITRGAHRGSGCSPFCYRRIVRAGALKELGRHRLFCVHGGAQALT